MIGVPDIGLQLTRYDLTKTCTINTFLFILTDNNNHRRLTFCHDQPFDHNSFFLNTDRKSHLINYRPTLTLHVQKSVQAKLLDTQEHFPDLHALVGLVQPHLIRLSSSSGARRVPGC